ncbi:hypothetical protein SYNPS1DRAFT_26894 [Syncephalis pseudoplumigaleata]|uniref:Kinase-like domain-containing protein n=1 Tax=Syncephalis pseudoplumigaleata TaxID=1712513 RepID=A0A4P9Z6Z2_9FUNG|nr:hypothetical protein SYNPS1DRAFT_26894 [Syncephalis pseudoplumigaleata]|eukprot:RKP27450.1 hypothetical protein SYNPS1DRAFT_26894 [Syncephalis pseudoplumigaleata]
MTRAQALVKRFIALAIALMLGSNALDVCAEKTNASLKKLFAQHQGQDLIPKLIIDKDVPAHRSQLLLGTGTYDGTPAFIKCNKDEYNAMTEREAFEASVAGRHLKMFGAKNEAARLVVNQYDSFDLPGDIYCDVLSTIPDAMDLITYSEETPPEKRIAMLESITHKLAQDVLINHQHDLLLIDLDRALVFDPWWEQKLNCPGTVGYIPPEFFIKRTGPAVHTRGGFKAYDAWQFGATLFALLSNTAPYGYRRTATSLTMLSDEDQEKEMRLVLRTHVVKRPRIKHYKNKLSKEDRKKLMQLVEWTKGLMKAHYAKRLTAEKLLRQIDSLQQ